LNSEELTGRQKAAVLMIALGPELSVQTFKHLNEKEIDLLTMEIANFRQVTSEQKEDVMAEFYSMLVAREYISEGGIGYAKDILEKALGSSRAIGIINRLKANLKQLPFDSARKANPKHLFSIIKDEKPQTIALILAYLDVGNASQILSWLGGEKQVEVTRRLATMEDASPDVLQNIEEFIDDKLSMFNLKTETNVGGIDSVVNVLNQADRSTEKAILQTLESSDPLLAESIRKKMFVFEDIVKLEDRFIQLIIREIDVDDLLISMRVSSEEMKKVFFRNMSTRRVESIKEELEYMGPIKLREVEEAQSRIVNKVRDLEDTGEIIINSEGDDILV
jgi:flagellar motor switch protein FliG